MKKIISVFLFIIGTFILGILYSHYIEPKTLMVKEYKVTNSLITDSFHGFKIVHITDLHYGTMVNEKLGKKLVRKINQIQPDIIVLTGDLFDSHVPLNQNEQLIVTELLESMKANIGKYAIKGEHDISHKEWESIMTECNFINLNDTYELIYKEDYTPILLAGLSTNIGVKKNVQEKLKDAIQYLTQYKETKGETLYSILLMHEPDTIDSIEQNPFHLILAGHSHGGQINIPVLQYYLSPKGAKKYEKEYYKIKNKDIYISTGIGTTTFTYRFLNKPSINFYRITNK